MRYVIVNDIHLSDQTPSSCTNSYQDDLFDLLDQTITACEKHDAVCIWAGDVFHYKTPGRTTHKTMTRLIALCRRYPRGLWIVPGNHDLTNDRVESIPHQPLGVLFASGAAHELNGWMIGHRVYGIPWQMRWDDTTVGDIIRELKTRSRAGHQAQLIVTHAPFYPPGRELRYENYPTPTVAQFLDQPTTIHYGHVHEPHGIYQVDKVRFSNCGALSRGSLHEHNLTRPVAIAVYDTDTDQIWHENLNAKPAAEVFRLEHRAEVRAVEHRLNTFLEKIGSTRIEITSIEQVMTHVRSLNVGEAVEQAVHALLVEAGV